MTLIETFINQLESVLSKTSTRQIKKTIGDSVNNHRVPTVSQVIRFLDATRRRQLATTLENVYGDKVIQYALKYQREARNYRQDGFDINEFKQAINDFGQAVTAHY